MCFFILFSAWWAYNGGLTYGPRFLLPILPVLGVLGMLWILPQKNPWVRYGLLPTMIFWGGYINFNSLLFPVNYHWHRWADAVDNWSVPVREKQLQLSTADRMQVFDPLYSSSLFILFRKFQQFLATFRYLGSPLSQVFKASI